MEKRNFKARKWLLDMAVGYTRLLETSRCKYQNIKTTTHQLKLMGKGEWRCSKKCKFGDSYTLITRIR